MLMRWNFVSALFFLSFFYFPKSQALIQYPYLNHNILQAAFEQDMDKCIFVEDIRQDGAVFVQNLRIDQREGCLAKKQALMKLFGQSHFISDYGPGYLLLINNENPLMAKENLSVEDMALQIQLLFEHNSVFSSVMIAGWVTNPQLPRVSPALMILYHPTIVSYYSDDISQNKMKTYLTAAQFYRFLFDFREWPSGVVHSIE
jgi:hypothetical protein